MEDILKTIIENLVDEKDKVEISRVDDEKGVLLKVKLQMKTWAKSSENKEELQKL